MTSASFSAAKVYSHALNKASIRGRGCRKVRHESLRAIMPMGKHLFRTCDICNKEFRSDNLKRHRINKKKKKNGSQNGGGNQNGGRDDGIRKMKFLGLLLLRPKSIDPR